MIKDYKGSHRPSAYISITSIYQNRKHEAMHRECKGVGSFQAAAEHGESVCGLEIGGVIPQHGRMERERAFRMLAAYFFFLSGKGGTDVLC